MNSKWMLVAALFVAGAAGVGCGSCAKDDKNVEPPSAPPPVTVQLAPPGASALPPVQPDALTKFFPKDGAGGFKRVMAGQKEGYVEAKLEKDGKEVAIVSITDAERLAYTKARFDGATEHLGEVPVVKVGDTQTLALVKERFQVKVFSHTLDHEARKAILASFDLKGLGS